MQLVFLLCSSLFAVGLCQIIVRVRRAIRGLGFKNARDLESLPVTPIAEARTGRRKFCGTALATESVQSLVNGVSCIALRRTTWLRSSSSVEIRTESRVFPFELNDGSGQTLTVDARSAILDYETASLPDAGASSAEEYLRAGDTLVVLGNVEVDEVDSSYRQRATPRIRFTSPPLVTWRSEPETLPKLRPQVVPIILTLLGSAGLVVAALDWSTIRDRGILVGWLVVCLFASASFGFGQR